MYESIRMAFGPSLKRTAPLKSKSQKIIADQKQQMDHVVEHYLELYSRENFVTSAP